MTRTIKDVAAVMLDKASSSFKTDNDAVDAIALSNTGFDSKQNPSTTQEEDLVLYRAAVRQNLLNSSLIQGTPLEFKGDFNGCNDSGSYEINTGYTEIDKFLETMLNIHVSFDWYNNEGGGGDITWLVSDDVVVINGYQYTTTSEDIMTEEKF